MTMNAIKCFHLILIIIKSFSTYHCLPPFQIEVTNFNYYYLD